MAQKSLDSAFGCANMISLRRNAPSEMVLRGWIISQESQPTRMSTGEPLAGQLLKRDQKHRLAASLHTNSEAHCKRRYGATVNLLSKQPHKVGEGQSRGAQAITAQHTVNTKQCRAKRATLAKWLGNSIALAVLVKWTNTNLAPCHYDKQHCQR